MTIRELIATLNALPDEQKDFLAVVASDPEGNSFDRVYDVSYAWYDTYERDCTGHIYDVTEDGEEIERLRTADECNAVVIWP